MVHGRLALVAAGMLFAQGCMTPAAVGPLDEGRTGETAAALLQQVIRIPSVNPPGGERPVALLLADVLRREGIATEVIEIAEGRAAVTARLPGSGEARPIVLLSHIDVVPTEGQPWSVPPFAGEIRDGYVWGRGALDNKGPTVVNTLALVALKRRGISLPRDVILLATPDEEAGGASGAGWIVEHRPDVVAGAELVLNEGGGIRIDESGALQYAISNEEKTPCWLRLRAEGPGGHGSVPRAGNPVVRIARAIDRIARIETPLEVSPEAQALLAKLAPEDERELYQDLARSLERDREFRTRFLADPRRAASVRDTIAVTVLRGSPKTNVLPTFAEAEVDSRLLPGHHCEAHLERVRQAIDDPMIDIEVLLSSSASSSPRDNALVRAIGDLATEEGATLDIVRLLGFTDSRFFRALGIDAYGFTPTRLPVDERRRVHGPDERISIENLERAIESVIEILRRLDSPGGVDPPRP